MGNFQSCSKGIWLYIIFFFTQILFRFLDCILQSCAIDSIFLHKTVLKSCLLRSTKSRIHSLWQFNKLVTNCTKRFHETVLIWGILGMCSIKYLWGSLCRSIKMRIEMFPELWSFWTSLMYRSKKFES